MLGSMIGRQLPIIALILPFYVTALYGGRRSVRALWPVLLVAGGSFAIMQFVSSNFIDYTLTDVLSSLGSLIAHLPNDRRVVLVVVGFCFGALLEGIAGFGTPVAITSSLLILVGFPPLEALVFVLIFNTAPVAFGALGVPVTVLAAVTGLPARDHPGAERIETFAGSSKATD